jgi:hypothetical protein
MPSRAPARFAGGWASPPPDRQCRSLWNRSPRRLYIERHLAVEVAGPVRIIAPGADRNIDDIGHRQGLCCELFADGRKADHLTNFRR